MGIRDEVNLCILLLPGQQADSPRWLRTEPVRALSNPRACKDHMVPLLRLLPAFLTADSRPTHMPRSSSVIAKPHQRPFHAARTSFSKILVNALCYCTQITMFSHNVYDMLRYTICRRHQANARRAAMTRTNPCFANQMGLV